jgi:ribosomal protein S18 acetylase RimI-like enzyme
VLTRVLEPRRGPELFVRPLRNGDERTVLALFARLSDESRRTRFHGPKPYLRAGELRHLARVDATHHVLVAHVEGDLEPVAIARLVCDGDNAEIAFAVVDDYQQRGIGATLTAALIDDARAAGIRHVTALVTNDNPAALALLRRVLEKLDVHFDGPALAVRAAIA